MPSIASYKTASKLEELFGVSTRRVGGRLSGWAFRKAHFINGSTAGPVSDYQIRIVVHYGSGTDSGEHVYLNEKCRPDFGDIRFTASDGLTELTYCIEKKIDRDYAIFWVKIPSIPASPDSVLIYIYYGNPDATTTSNPDNTFVFFDDFENTTKLSISLSDAGTYEFSTLWAYRGSYSLRYVETSTTLGGVLLGTYSIPQGYYASELMVKPSFNDAIKEQGVRIIISDNIMAGFRNVGADNDPRLIITDYTTGTTLEYKATTNWTQENIYRLVVKSRPDGLLEIVLYKADGTVFDSFTSTNTYTQNMTGVKINSGAAQTGDCFIDTLFVRKYIDPEPTHGDWGPEQFILKPYDLY